MSESITSFESITSLFQRLRETAPQRRIFTYVDDNGDDQESLTVEELGEAADRVVVALRSWGYAPGDRAILVYPPSLDFVKAFLGCLAAGVIPVPVYPPNPFKLRKDLATLPGSRPTPVRVAHSPTACTTAPARSPT